MLTFALWLVISMLLYICTSTTPYSFLVLGFDSYSDAQNPRFVYDWRQEQERTLIAAKGTGMTEEQVNHFVDGCMLPQPPPFHQLSHEICLLIVFFSLVLDYPSYELFTETLRNGVFRATDDSGDTQMEWRDRQLRLVVDRNRRVQEVIRI